MIGLLYHYRRHVLSNQKVQCVSKPGLRGLNLNPGCTHFELFGSPKKFLDGGRIGHQTPPDPRQDTGVTGKSYKVLSCKPLERTKCITGILYLRFGGPDIRLTSDCRLMTPRVGGVRNRKEGFATGRERSRESTNYRYWPL